jgi:hypothetical protein
MTKREVIEMTSHNIKPCINGLMPTALSVARERLVPIRNKVTVIPALARFTRESKMLGIIQVGA